MTQLDKKTGKETEVFNELTGTQEDLNNPLVAVKLHGPGPAWAATIAVVGSLSVVGIALKEVLNPTLYIAAVATISLMGLLAVVRCRR